MTTMWIAGYLTDPSSGERYRVWHDGERVYYAESADDDDAPCTNFVNARVSYYRECYNENILFTHFVADEIAPVAADQ